ncbi:MAG: hypothetical protein Q4F28_12905 [Eubacteriales bacterium]|nr:hypothetical protein [Eubacteriales bacterium]
MMNAMMDTQRPCTITESIKKSCQEVSLMRQGKLPKHSWADFRKRMEEEAKDE